MSKELVITKTIADKICQQLMSGIPLARISKDKDMPGLTRIYKEIAKNKEFSNQISGQLGTLRSKGGSFLQGIMICSCCIKQFLQK